MRERSWGIAALLLGAMALAFLVFISPAQAVTFYPRNSLASLHFSCTSDPGLNEIVFPVRGSSGKLMNARMTGVEQAREFSLWYKIGTNLTGTSMEGWQIYGDQPNNQTPSYYLHRVDMGGGWVCYEYWIYYPYDPHAAGPAHEHDWEGYNIWFFSGSHYSLFLSAHGWPYPGSMWWQWTSKLEPGTNHVKLSVEYGSHALVNDPYGPINGGVRIRYDGYTTQRAGYLAAGDNSTWTPYLYCNDAGAMETTTFSQSPTSYYRGNGSSEWSDPMPAPRNRPEWNNPGSPYPQ